MNIGLSGLSQWLLKENLRWQWTSLVGVRGTKKKYRQLWAQTFSDETSYTPTKSNKPMWTLGKYMIENHIKGSTAGARIIERKLRSTKVRLFTVPCCSIILFSSEGVKKNVSEFTPNFFRRSIILVGALLFYNYVFPHFSHISHFRSIINVSRAPFYN